MAISCFHAVFILAVLIIPREGQYQNYLGQRKGYPNSDIEVKRKRDFIIKIDVAC